MHVIRSNSWHSPSPARQTARHGTDEAGTSDEASGLSGDEARPVVLSPREIECLEWLARGYQDGRIAGQLNLSRSTVRLHLANARRKLKAKTREQALVRALQWRLIVP